MSLDLLIRQVTQQELPRPPVRAAGPDRVAGAPPPTPNPEVGPPNPRLRMDRDLGMVVIEFRDSAGRISNSLPTERELRAYRASVNYGADLPAFMGPGGSDPITFTAPSFAAQQPLAASSASVAFSSLFNFTTDGLRRTA